MPLNQILRLKGAVQHYPWGGFQFISDLISETNETRQPYAELWMGAHPRGPARVVLNGQGPGLDELINRSPDTYLGSRIARKFDRRLPFLFKVLDVRKMLSIQAHPNKQQAIEGFRLENEKGIPLDAPQRLFKDDNHKPEIMVALTDFWLLHGFKSLESIRETLEIVPELRQLRPQFGAGDLRSLYRYVMGMPQKEVNNILQPMNERLRGLKEKKGLSKDMPEYWAWQAFEDYTTAAGEYDRGIFSIFLFNLTRISPGEGIFQDAGIPHAYLEGVNVELMANSDNVFRGGLTPKHVDVPALMHHLVFEPVSPQILRSVQLSDCEWFFPTPSPDFRLSRITLDHGLIHHEKKSNSPKILIVMEGSTTVDGRLEFGRGGMFFIKPGASHALKSTERSLLFKASVP